LKKFHQNFNFKNRGVVNVPFTAAIFGFNFKVFDPLFSKSGWGTSGEAGAAGAAGRPASARSAREGLGRSPKIVTFFALFALYLLRE
jgi:hypothetical protein